MKKFAAFLVILSLGLFTLGCGESAPAKKTGTPAGGTAPAAKTDTKADAKAAAPAGGAAPAGDAAKEAPKAK